MDHAENDILEDINDTEEIELSDLPNDYRKRTATGITGNLGSFFSNRRRRHVFLTSIILVLAVLFIQMSVPVPTLWSRAASLFSRPVPVQGPGDADTPVVAIRNLGPIQVITSHGISIVVNNAADSEQGIGTPGPAPVGCPAVASDNYDLYHEQGHGYNSPSSPVSLVGFEMTGDTIHLSQSGVATSFGWATFIHVKVLPHFIGTIMLQGWNVTNDIPLTFDMVPYAIPTGPFVLDTLHPLADPYTDKQQVHLWNLHMYVPMTGCYFFRAAWPGGQWHMTVAVGK